MPPVGPYPDHAACVAANQDVSDPDAFCAWLEEQSAAVESSGEFTGAIVSLIPSAAEAERLAVAAGLPAEDLHVTLAWLGDTDDDPAPTMTFEEAFSAMAAAIQSSIPPGPVTVDVFSHAVFNPDSDDKDPATVLLLQGDELVDLHAVTLETVADASDFAVWFPHLTLGYNLDALDDSQVSERMGPAIFDRIRISFGSAQAMEIKLGGEPMTASTKAARRIRVVNGSKMVTASTCVPCQGFADDVQLEAPVDVGTVADVEAGARWEGVLAVEGVPTGDGRMFDRGSMRWDNLPVPLRWVRQDEGEHYGAVVVGRIDEVWRDGNQIRGRGVFDAGSEDGIEAARQVREQLTRGVSVDVDDVDMEIRIAAEVLEEMEPADEMPSDDPDEGVEPSEEDDEGRVVVAEISTDDELAVMTDARLRAATIVATPAFVEAQIDIDDTPDGEEPEPEPVVREAETILAGASAAAPPAEWFADPKLSGPTPVTVTDDGRIYGHLAAWGTCHTAYRHECVTPPSSASSYAYFRTGAVRAADGSTIATGRITLDTNHAGRKLGPADTAAHYEHTGLAVADVAAGEDGHGIWIAGAVRPGTTDEQIRALQASPLSGDWRRIGGSLELVAALAVNSPGFPIPRALVAGGNVQTLQASGVLEAQARPAADTSDDDRLLASIIERERRDEQRRRAAADEARRRVLVASAVAKRWGH